jgi:hypothetical protein
MDNVRFIGHDTATVQLSARFSEGILLMDGARLPPFSDRIEGPADTALIRSVLESLTGD